MSGESTQFAELLTREALLLDRGAYQEWLDLYTPDCVFWMPAWRDDGTQTQDPDRELSLIYYRGRRNLKDRVKRIQSGLSVASSVMPRVSHMIGNVLVEASDGQRARIASVFTVHVHDVRTSRAHVFFGRYEHELVFLEGRWMIAGKVIRLMNDVIPTLLDIYSI